VTRRSFASAQQVADRAGVSRSAVSRTFTPGRQRLGRDAPAGAGGGGGAGLPRQPPGPLRPDRPDAAFCINDLVAFGFLDAARHDLGLRVPEDLCVIGFDNTEQAGWSAYDLTTFDQSVEATGDAVMAALDAPEGAAPLWLNIPAPLVWRRTVRGRPPAG
jgi:DNA-binding LacI/PurR family transcriptional regulator